MRLLQHPRRRAPRAESIRPAAQYLDRGADEARRIGDAYVGTEHVLLALTRDPAALGKVGVTLQSALAIRAPGS